LARLRMARLFVAIDKHSEALQLINVDYPENFTVMFEELKGDIYVMTKDFNNARAAYDKAILASSEQPSRWLRLKREDLGDAQVNEPAA
ncbi:MAG: tetratricopeptide repeat protein, partial [Gammaproteobacteria bacterium]|nr:tetratricopeptide repeat protein [Gammaproteobacteria bacterium]